VACSREQVSVRRVEGLDNMWWAVKALAISDTPVRLQILLSSSHYARIVIVSFEKSDLEPFDYYSKIKKSLSLYKHKPYEAGLSRLLRNTFSNFG